MLTDLRCLYCGGSLSVDAAETDSGIDVLIGCDNSSCDACWYGSGALMRAGAAWLRAAEAAAARIDAARAVAADAVFQHRADEALPTGTDPTTRAWFGGDAR